MKDIQDEFLPIQIKHGRLVLTPSLCFIVTSACNLNCEYCYNRSYTKEYMPTTMPHLLFDDYLSYMSNPAQLPLQILFFGGEPTLNLTTVLKAVNDIKYQDNAICYRIATNGVMEEKVLRDLIAAKIALQISFDGIQDTIRLSDPHRQIVLNNIRTLVKNQYPITIRSVIHKENMHWMVDIVQFAKTMGINNVQFVPLMPVAVDFDVKQYTENFFQALLLAKQLGITMQSQELGLYRSRGLNNNFPALVCLPDGSLSFTTRFASSSNTGAAKYIIGKYDGKLCFNYEVITKMLRSFLEYRNRYCLQCSIWSYCKGMNNFERFTVPPASYTENYSCAIMRSILQKVPMFMAG